MKGKNNILVTGGAGFIGSNFINTYVPEAKYNFINLDKLTYAGDLKNIAVSNHENYTFIEGDICDKELLNQLFKNINLHKSFILLQNHMLITQFRILRLLLIQILPVLLIC